MSPADPPISQQQLGAGIQHEIGQLAIPQWLRGGLYPDLSIPRTLGDTPRGSIACSATNQQGIRKPRVARMPSHQSSSLGDHAPAPSVRVCPITDLGTLRIPPKAVQTDRAQASVLFGIGNAPRNTNPSRGQLGDALQVRSCAAVPVRPRHRGKPVGRLWIRAGFDNTLYIPGMERP